MRLLLYVVFLIEFVCAIAEVAEFSVPSLVTVSSLNEISQHWYHNGDAQYDEGRILLTPKPTHGPSNDGTYQSGSIWSVQSPSLNEFTIEVTLRSLGSHGFTNAGVSLFLIDEKSVDLQDSDGIFGGPTIFKGLQLTMNVDKDLGSVIKIFLNDGKKLDYKKDFLGAYKYEYQSSNVPLTIKIGYSNKFFKVTCDNILLFETDRVNLSELLKSNLKLGVSGKSPKLLEKHEQFELLRLITYDAVVPELKEVEDETLVAMHDKDLAQSKPTIDFIERQEQLRKKLEIPASNNLNSLDEIKDIKDGLQVLMKMINSNDQTVLQQQVFSLSKSVNRLTNNFDGLHAEITRLVEKYSELSSMFDKQAKLLDNYDSTLRSFDKVLRNQLETSENLGSKLSTLSSYYTEKNKVEEKNDSGISHIKSLIYMIFLPILFLLLVVALWVQRLRNDIKHAKVL